ncbi:MAG: DUF1730 domain-containing protein [Fibrobacteres bacterium]|nr:DUF1730 domain-containing protein [Fibrobacterota bacterium]
MNDLTSLTPIVLELKRVAADNGILNSVITDLSLPANFVEKYDAAVENMPIKSLRSRRNERLMVAPVLKEAKTMLIGFVPYPSALESPHIASYALCDDYHAVILERLNLVALRASELLPGIKHYSFVDAMPVAEKLFAEKAGIGFRGRNTLITNCEHGSKIFICGILFSAELPLDEIKHSSEKSICSRCMKCEIECPTGALKGGCLDAAKCLANQTIENRSELTTEQLRALGDVVFGCGICVNVCPYNAGKPVKRDTKWNIRADLAGSDKATLYELATADFRGNFANTPIERAGADKFIRILGAS